MDWRLHQNGDMTDGSIALPEAVYQACLKQLHSLGLVAGAFDFIVTPEDEWVYLEVNEAGQFIFVEQWCEELTVFDALCGFIESGNKSFRYQQTSDAIHLKDLIESVKPETVSEQDKLRREPSKQIETEAA